MIKMVLLVLLLSLCIVPIQQENVPVIVNECNYQVEEVYRVCQQEKEYFNKNLQ
jgi:hypothetical protein